MCRSVCFRCSDLFFFFFKQKTAYEMRISDWSSDVCSSDLPTSAKQRSGTFSVHTAPAGAARTSAPISSAAPPSASVTGVVPAASTRQSSRKAKLLPSRRVRSEEHTSELQSLMRNSYAVFCFKKKKNNTETHIRVTF